MGGKELETSAETISSWKRERPFLSIGGPGCPPQSPRALQTDTAHRLPCWPCQPSSLSRWPLNRGQARPEEAPAAQLWSLQHSPALKDFSSGPGDRAHKAHRRCGAHRQCGAQPGRACRGHTRAWSTGYRATCGRKTQEGTKEAEWATHSASSAPSASQIHPLLTFSTHFPGPSLHHLHLCDPRGHLTGLPTLLLPLLTITNLVARGSFYKQV